MEKIDKAIEILQAFKEGKTIQYKIAVDWLSIANEDLILEYLNTGKYQLRIKPESKYRPYANTEEFLRDSWKHGPYIGDGAKLFTAKEIGGNYIKSSAEDLKLSFTELCFDSYKWQDGSPCGIKE